MVRALCQQALDRVLAYLVGYGIPPTNDVCRRALQLVDLAMAEGSEDAIARSMDLIPEYFSLPAIEVPPQRPELSRSSIGYWRNA